MVFYCQETFDFISYNATLLLHFLQKTYNVAAFVLEFFTKGHET